MLTDLNRARSAGADGKTLAYYALNLSGFDEHAVIAACDALRLEEVDPFGKWPPLARFQDLCRRFTPASETHWTLDRYREAWYIDKWVQEQREFYNLSTEEALGRRSEGDRAMWAAWKNQTLAGTIQVPALWHEECRGTGLIPVWGRSPNPAITTPVCLRHEKCGCRAADGTGRGN